MKKIFTSFIVLFLLLTVHAQENIIKNGGFEEGVTDSSKIAYLDYWHMDKENPGSGWWGDAANRRVTLTSGDSATLYQVVEVILADSVLYVLTVSTYDSWNTDKVVLIASTSEADTSVRTLYKTDTMDVGNLEFQFGFSAGSAYAGKKLIVEFTCTQLSGDAAWTHFDDVSLIKRLPGVNNPPVADAGEYQTATGGNLVTLDGSGSYDPDGDDITYQWISTFPGITLSDPNAESPTFTAPDVSELSAYSFALFVNDGTVNSDTVLTKVTVIPAGELIRNGDFSMKTAGADPGSESLKDIAYWNIDQHRDSIAETSGVLDIVWLAALDSTLYQVVDVIGTQKAVYTLSFSGRSSWDSHSINSVFSVSDADSSLRTPISTQENLTGIDPGNDIHTSSFEKYKHVLNIEAGSAHAGKKLILEFDNIGYDGGQGWCELEYASLIKEIDATSVLSIEGEKLSLYPNPASRLLYIQGNEEVREVNIYSLTGVMVKSIRESNIRQINIEDLHTGMYIVTLHTREGFVNKKLQVK